MALNQIRYEGSNRLIYRQFRPLDAVDEYIGDYALVTKPPYVRPEFTIINGFIYKRDELTAEQVLENLTERHRRNQVFLFGNKAIVHGSYLVKTASIGDVWQISNIPLALKPGFRRSGVRIIRERQYNYRFTPDSVHSGSAEYSYKQFIAHLQQNSLPRAQYVAIWHALLQSKLLNFEIVAADDSTYTKLHFSDHWHANLKIELPATRSAAVIGLYLQEYEARGDPYAILAVYDLIRP